MRMRVALSGLTMAEYFRDQDAQGRAAVHRQHLPLCAGGQRGFHAAGPHAFRRGLPAHAGQRTWARCRSASPPPRSGSVTSVQAVYVPADDLTDPAPATTFTHLDATTVLSRKIAEQGIYPGGGPAGIHLPHSGSGYRGRGALPRGAQRAGDPAEVQRTAGHHRHSRHGRTRRRGQKSRSARAPRSSASCRSPSTWRKSFPACRAATCPARRRSVAFAKSWTARWTIIPRRRSSTWAA